jgi:hypothetical protein
LNGQNFCLHCMARQPLRSRHCRHCNRCVARFDQYANLVYQSHSLALLTATAAIVPGFGTVSACITTASSSASFSSLYQASLLSITSLFNASKQCFLLHHILILFCEQTIWRIPQALTQPQCRPRACSHHLYAQHLRLTPRHLSSHYGPPFRLLGHPSFRRHISIK